MTQAARMPGTGTSPILDCALDLLCAAVPRPGQMIDIPCGTGYLSMRAAGRGWQVAPCDLHPEQWEGDSAVAVRQEDLNGPLSLDSASADAVVCCEGLEHVENPWLVLREFRRVLRPAGHVIVSLPNTIDLRQRFRMLRRGYWGHYLPRVPGHINPMGPFVLCHALVRTGFTICAIRSPKTYGGFGYRALAPWFRFRPDCGLPPAVRAMLSHPDVLCGRTAVIHARAETAQRAAPERA